jgi:hypothetical protein
MSKDFHIATVLLLLTVFSLFIFEAQAQQVVLRTSTLSAGANISNGSTVVLQSTLGQAIVGSSVGSAHQVNAGFWFQARPPAMVAVNQPPSAPQIIEPADGTEIVIGGDIGEPPLDPHTPFVVAWMAATDPEGSAIIYTWQLATGEGFTNVLLHQETGSTTRYETTLGAVAAALDQAGVSLHDPVTLHHRVLASDGQLSTASATAQIMLTRGTLTDTEEEADVPTQFRLMPNYPNPFNPSTTIAYDLPASAEVTLTVFDVQGREVRRFAQGLQPAGHYEINFEAGDLASGVYLYRMVAGPYRATQKMLLLK